MKAADVFVSYASKDSTFVEPIVELLRRNGVTVWQDQTGGILAGQNYGEEIVHAINQSKVVIVACSPNSFASDNVHKEIMLTWESHRNIIPVWVSHPIPIPEKIAYWLVGCQWVRTVGRLSDDWISDLILGLKTKGIEINKPLPGKQRQSRLLNDVVPKQAQPLLNATLDAKQPKNRFKLYFIFACLLIGLAVSPVFFHRKTKTAEQLMTIGVLTSDTAQDEINRALATTSDNPDLYIRRAIIRCDRSDLKGALVDLNQSISITPLCEAYAWSSWINNKLGSDISKNEISTFHTLCNDTFSQKLFDALEHRPNSLRQLAQIAFDGKIPAGTSSCLVTLAMDVLLDRDPQAASRFGELSGLLEPAIIARYVIAEFARTNGNVDAKELNAFDSLVSKARQNDKNSIPVILAYAHILASKSQFDEATALLQMSPGNIQDDLSIREHRAAVVLKWAKALDNSRRKDRLAKWSLAIDLLHGTKKQSDLVYAVRSRMKDQIELGDLISAKAGVEESLVLADKLLQTSEYYGLAGRFKGDCVFVQAQIQKGKIGKSDLAKLYKTAVQFGSSEAANQLSEIHKMVNAQEYGVNHDRQSSSRMLKIRDALVPVTAWKVLRCMDSAGSRWCRIEIAVPPSAIYPEYVSDETADQLINEALNFECKRVAVEYNCILSDADVVDIKGKLNSMRVACKSGKSLQDK